VTDDFFYFLINKKMTSQYSRSPGTCTCSWRNVSDC